MHDSFVHIFHFIFFSFIILPYVTNVNLISLRKQKLFEGIMSMYNACYIHGLIIPQVFVGFFCGCQVGHATNIGAFRVEIPLSLLFRKVYVTIIGFIAFIL